MLRGSHGDAENQAGLDETERYVTPETNGNPAERSDGEDDIEGVSTAVARVSKRKKAGRPKGSKDANAAHTYATASENFAYRGGEDRRKCELDARQI